MRVLVSTAACLIPMSATRKANAFSSVSSRVARISGSESRVYDDMVARSAWPNRARSLMFSERPARGKPAHSPREKSLESTCDCFCQSVKPRFHESGFRGF